jgi:hypothetical protein
LALKFGSRTPSSNDCDDAAKHRLSTPTADDRFPQRRFIAI